MGATTPGSMVASPRWPMRLAGTRRTWPPSSWTISRRPTRRVRCRLSGQAASRSGWRLRHPRPHRLHVHRGARPTARSWRGDPAVAAGLVLGEAGRTSSTVGQRFERLPLCGRGVLRAKPLVATPTAARCSRKRGWRASSWRNRTLRHQRRSRRSGPERKTPARCRKRGGPGSRAAPFLPGAYRTRWKFPPHWRHAPRLAAFADACALRYRAARPKPPPELLAHPEAIIERPKSTPALLT
jgi:hypothetical protein